MLTYQIRPRVLKTTGDVAPEFPADVVINYYLQPLQAFGDSNLGGRLFIHNGVGQGILFNANTGQYTTNTNGAMKSFHGDSADRQLSIRGHRLTRRVHCQDAQDLHSAIESVCFVVPLFLSLDLADPPFVERVDGTINGVEFRWELAKLTMQPRVVSPDALSLTYVRAFAELNYIVAPEKRTLLAALTHFYTGSRLLREAKTPGEFT